MSLTPSNMLPLGSIAPDFSLPDSNANMAETSLQSLRAEKATLIMFICNHCPYVKHIKDALIALAKDYQDEAVSIIAISANDADTYPDDAPAKMTAEAYPFPYLYDASQAVAKAYDAACTPDFYLFDGELRCAYRGQFDASRPGNDIPVTGRDVRAALDAVLSDQPVDSQQQPSMGCNIKWR